MTTESESRMREVLDRIFDYGIDRSILKAPCMFCGYKGEGYWQRGTHDERCPWRYVGGEFDRDQKLRDVVLSPPARRTITDADVESMIDVEFIVRRNASRRFSDDPYTFGLMQRMVIEGAKAALAGLEKEEERSVPSVRSVLAKHGLIDKVPTSGEEIERACRSSEQEGEG